MSQEGGVVPVIDTWPVSSTPLYPHDQTRRKEIRDLIFEREIRKAVIRAAEAGLSLRCRKGDHGCLNNGTNCLCECHDLATPDGR